MPKTITVESTKSETLLFGLPTDAIIEQNQSVDDYAAVLSDAVLRLARLKSKLAEVTKRNHADYTKIAIEVFALWAIQQMLDKWTLTEVPIKVEIPLTEYKEVNANFTIHNFQNETLLITMQEIFATIGDEPHPTFLTSLAILSPRPFFHLTSRS